MQKTSLMLMAALALPAGAALAADQPGTAARVFVNVPKAGMTAQYEAGRKKHMDWHRRQNDSWAWLTWEIETGERTGSYIVGTFAHQWKDFDEWEKKLGAPDVADGQINLGPFEGPGGTNGFYAAMPDVSHPTPGTTPAVMTELLFYQLSGGGEQEFRNGIKKVHEAIQKGGMDWHYVWYELVNGGDHPNFVLAIDMNGWADLGPSPTPFPVLMAKTFGEFETAEILKSIDHATKSVRSEVVKYRADLSYVPAAK